MFEFMRMSNIIRHIFYYTPKIKKIYLSSTKYNYQQNIKFGGCQIILTHLIRGSLIEIKFNNSDICSYVDQNIQLNNFLGINDIENNLTKNDMKYIIKELKRIKKEK